MILTTPCPCGSKKNYGLCCEPIIMSKKPATTAEQLMRSRYVAFTLANVDYLLKSHHSKSRPLKDRKNILIWAKKINWLGLIIHNTSLGLINHEQGYVEFSAMYSENGKLEVIHEKSLFVRENGKWVYLSGEHI